MKSTAINVGLVFFSVFLAIILGECAARFYFLGSLNPLQTEAYGSFRKPDPVFGWKLIPNVDVWLRRLDYSVHYKTNSHGFHDKDRQYAKGENIYRIVILGDSFMEAYFVYYEDSFAGVLEKTLNEDGHMMVETVNLGVGGYGTAQEYLVQTRIAEKFDPDMILLAYLPANDMRNNSRDLEYALWGQSNLIKVNGRPYVDGWAEGKPTFSFPPPSFIEQKQKEFSGVRRSTGPWYEGVVLKFYLDRFMANLERKEEIKHDPNVLLGPYLKKFHPQWGKSALTTNDWERMWRESRSKTFRIIEAMNDHAQELGAEFCVFSVPSRISVESDKQMAVMQQLPEGEFDFDAPYLDVAQYLEEKGINHIGLLLHFKNAYSKGRSPLYNQNDDKHWNANGCRLAANVVADVLRERIVNSDNRN